MLLQRASTYGISSGIALLFFIAILLFGCRQSNITTIGIVNSNPGLEPVIEGFKKGMAGYGYIEGSNIIYRYKGIVKDTDQIDAALLELINDKVDLILTITTPVTLRAKKLTENNNIPVVFAPVFFAVETGLVTSLTHPGGNLTGIQMGGNTQKALEWHKAAAPHTRHLYIPYKPDDKAAQQSLVELKKAAAKLGVEPIVAEVNDRQKLKAALDNMPRQTDSLWLLNSHFLITHADIFTEAALKNRLPLSSGTSQTGTGALISYGQKPFRTGEQASRLVRNILTGISPAEVPVETADYYLTINLKTARAIGIVVPHDLLKQADELIR